MRIAHVTCLYVPEHHGGAPQQCHQVAVGQAAHGHDVAVFSGALRHDLPPLQVERTVQDGLPVTRVVTTAAFVESEERNWRHPEVEPAFREFLGEHRPDVVHFHSIQSLGASLVPLARACGARTVVTMHDLWWVCQRQFGVDRRFRACIPSVTPGSCACECGVAELSRRRRYLAGVLREVDLLLAPSASLAERLRVSGIEGVEVDPNSVARDDAPRPAPAGPGAAGPLRLLYVGGASRRKGVRVLAGALRLCARQGVAYAADLYGLDEGSPETAALLRGVSGRACPPFDPDERAAVMAAHDVLVLPSLGQESSSLAVREALVHGLAVIASECGGPQEVVEHEVNGLLVPQDDAGALAAAVARLAADRDLLGRLRHAGARGPLPAPDAHAESLERTYHSVHLARRSAAPAADRAPELGQALFVAGEEGASLRYRVHQKMEQLRLLGVDSVLRRCSDPRLEADLDRCEVVIVHRAPATRELMRFIRLAHRRRRPVLFDADDLGFDPDLVESAPAAAGLSADARDALRERARRLRATLLECGLGIAATKEVARHLAGLGVPARVHRSAVDTRLAVLSERARRARGSRRREAGEELVIGCHLDGGTSAGAPAALAGFLRAHPEARLLIAGASEPPPDLAGLGARARCVAAAWDRRPDQIATFDLAVVLLAEGVHGEARSAVEWLEAALVDVPTLASSRQPFRESIGAGRTGFLADAAEWPERLEEALADRDRLARVGRAARLAAFGQGSPWVMGRSLLGIIGELRSGPRAEALTPEDDRWPAESGVSALEPALLLPGLRPSEDGAAAGPGAAVGGCRVGFALPAKAGPLRRVDVRVAAPGAGEVVLTLRGPDGAALSRAAAPAGETGAGGWAAFEIDPPLEAPDGTVAELTAGAGEGFAACVAVSGRRAVDGRGQPGALIARTFHEPPVPPDFGDGDPDGDDSAPPPPAARPGVARRAVEVVRAEGPVRGARRIAGAANRRALDWLAGDGPPGGRSRPGRRV